MKSNKMFFQNFLILFFASCTTLLPGCTIKEQRTQTQSARPSNLPIGSPSPSSDSDYDDEEENQVHQLVREDGTKQNEVFEEEKVRNNSKHDVADIAKQWKKHLAKGGGSQGNSGNRDPTIPVTSSFKISGKKGGPPLPSLFDGKTMELPDPWRKTETYSWDPVFIGKSCLYYVNEFRYDHNLKPLQWNNALYDIGQKHAEQMARGDMPFSHKDADKRYNMMPSHSRSGENLGLKYQSHGMYDVAREIVDGWIDSPGHRKNLLETRYTDCGIGVGRITAKKGNRYRFKIGTFYATQMLMDGRPMRQFKYRSDSGNHKIKETKEPLERFLSPSVRNRRNRAG